MPTYEILKLAKECGITERRSRQNEIELFIALEHELLTFAQAIRNQALEEAEKVCEEHSHTEPQFKAYEDTYENGWLDAANECTWAIRALKEEK